MNLKVTCGSSSHAEVTRMLDAGWHFTLTQSAVTSVTLNRSKQPVLHFPRPSMPSGVTYNHRLPESCAMTVGRRSHCA